MSRKTEIKGAGGGILTGVCWAVSSVFSQYLFTNTTMTFTWFVAVRMLAAGIFLTVLSICTNRKELKELLSNKADLLQCGVTGVLGMLLFQLTCYGTVQKSNAATAIVLQYLCPVMVMIYVCAKAKRKPKGYEILSLIFAISGIFLIATHCNIKELVITEEALIWGIGCAFFMALSSIIPETLFQRYSSQTITAAALFIGGITACILINPVKNPPVMDQKALVVLVAAILCGSILAYLCYGIAIKNTGPSRASLYACVEIPVTTILSAAFLGNTFMWMDILGFGLIASTIFILTLCKKNSGILEK